MVDPEQIQYNPNRLRVQYWGTPYEYPKPRVNRLPNRQPFVPRYPDDEVLDKLKQGRPSRRASMLEEVPWDADLRLSVPDDIFRSSPLLPKANPRFLWMTREEAQQLDWEDDFEEFYGFRHPQRAVQPYIPKETLTDETEAEQSEPLEGESKASEHEEHPGRVDFGDETRRLSATVRQALRNYEALPSLFEDIGKKHKHPRDRIVPSRRLREYGQQDMGKEIAKGWTETRAPLDETFFYKPIEKKKLTDLYPTTKPEKPKPEAKAGETGKAATKAAGDSKKSDVPVPKKSDKPSRYAL